MTRSMLVIFVNLSLLAVALVSSVARAIANTGVVSRECYAAVGLLLRSTGGKLTPEVRNGYLAWAEQTILQQLHQSKQAVPESCLVEVRRDDTLRDAIYGSVFPPDPSILQNYAQLRAQLVAINAAVPTSTPNVDGKVMPWPLLMPLAHPIPLSEANYIGEAFQCEHGPDRYHTYGPNRGDDDVMPDSLRPSKWFWDAWPDRIVHGGMCAPISKGTVDLYSALGKPAMWTGQPGHANLISFQSVGGAWTAEIEQAFAGGPDVTHAQYRICTGRGSPAPSTGAQWRSS